MCLAPLAFIPYDPKLDERLARSRMPRWGLPRTCVTPIGSTLISRSRIGINTVGHGVTVIEAAFGPFAGISINGVVHRITGLRAAST